MPEPSATLSVVLIALMKGIVTREEDASFWQAMLAQQARIRDHVVLLGLELILDESEGHAFLRQRPTAEGEAPLPRLVARRRLGYAVSLLLALLRKRLAEFDATSGDTRLVLSREAMVDMVRLFLPDAANEARLMDQIDAHIDKVVEMGFLRRLRGEDDQFEVRRILKAFVDAQWLFELDAQLAAYREHAREALAPERREA
ncbi:MAG: DUF4194 domain-containing protein [Xanthobacteraceae bacterium]|nr:DUF4194 domain-containing protein [Xanthobacteraceae bacterium]GIK82542.1 MAG: hypothetical protein BroJett024_36470 [Alphaproteobacteria bacterium]